jgi:DNA primase
LNNNIILEELKYRNDIEDVISSYVNLKRSGTHLQGLCPFHSEKTPSFTVFTATSSFYCFGCGAGGDVVTFVMRAENLDFTAALEFLAKRSGMTLPVKGENEHGAIKRARILEMNRVAARFFHDNLKQSQTAMEYLSGRMLAGSVIKRFGLGWAPDEFGKLTAYMHKSGYSDEELSAGFLCGISRKTKRSYDYFRGRVMFPIIDLTGNIIAFGGRLIGDGMPKYLNTSDTPAFKKSRHLFALNFAKNECAEELILCEGYMDVIALHAAGFSNAVATLGTAITAEQARLMKRYTKKVIIAYDNDNAGQNAADKAFRLLEETGLIVKIINMQNAKDPDEYIRKYGADKFRLLLDGSVSRFDFMTANITARYDLNILDDKIKATQETAEYISHVYSAVERELYIAKAADKFDINPENLKNDVSRRMRANMKNKKNEESRQIYLKASGINDRINPEAVKNIKGANAERDILGLILCYPELNNEIMRGNVKLTADDFVTEFNRRIFETIIANSDENGAFDFGILGAEFTIEEMGRITKMRLDRESFTKNDIIVLRECVETLKDTKEKSLEDIINDKRNKSGGTADK